MSVEAPRASFLPTIKCSDCNREVDLMALADHECTGTPTYADDVLAFSPALIPEPLRIGPKVVGLDLSSARPRPPAIDPQAANRPFFKNTTSGTPSSNHSSRSDANTNASSNSSNFLSVSNSTANTTPISEDSSLKSPIRLFMPLLSPRGESPTDPNYIPVSPITDNSNILKRMDTIAPGPFSLASPALKRGFPKPLPQVPAPLIKEPEFKKELPTNPRGIGLATLQSRPKADEPKPSKPDDKQLSKKLPSVPGEENKSVERKPTSRRGTNRSRDKVTFADGTNPGFDESTEPSESRPLQRSMTRAERPIPTQRKPFGDDSPPRLEQRSNTFAENTSQQQPATYPKKDLASRFNIPMGLPRRPSEPTAALKSVPSVRIGQTSDNTGRNAAPAPAPSPQPPATIKNNRLVNPLSHKNSKSLPQSPKPENLMRGPRRSEDDSNRAREPARAYDDLSLPRGEPARDRDLGGPAKAKTWDGAPEKPSKSRKVQHISPPEQTSPSKGKQAAICRECRLPIEGERPVSSSDGKLSGKFHKKCFKCAHCKDPFYPSAALGQPSRKEQPSTFYIIDDQPYCAHDYHARNNSLCPACGLGIEGDCYEIDFDTPQPKRFHIAGCFACAVPGCNEGFENGYYEGGTNNKSFFCVRHVPKNSKSTRRYTRLMPLI